MSRKMQAQPSGLSDETGFTLIELMVVVLIIAILLAIAIPTFLGSQAKAKDRSAQSSLQIALSAAKAIYSDSNNYTTAIPSALGPVEPSVTFLPNSSDISTKPKDVSVKSTSSIFYAAALSQTGTCFYIKDDMSVGRKFSNAVPPQNCTGDDAASTAASGWRDSW